MVQTRDTSADIVVGPIVLVGMMGVGKTTVGLRLAEMLGFAHKDSDTEIERAADRTITEIFAEFGEPYFREGEVRVIERLLSARNVVISTGGGAFIQAPVRQMIKAHGTSIWLDAKPDLLWEHVKLKAGRPLLDKPNPKAVLTELCAERAPIYAQADHRIEIVAGQDQGAVAAQILELLNMEAVT